MGEELSTVSREPVEVDIEVIRKTHAAVLVNCRAGEVWLPLSQIEYETLHEGDYATVSIPEWLAVEKGLV